MTLVRATSDLHGTLPTIEPCDLLLIAGDICPVDNHELTYQHQWLDGPFRNWLSECQGKAGAIVGIAGNHDFIFEREPATVAALHLPWTYLEDDQVEVD